VGFLVLVIGIIYILSPVDMWPGILDDIACLILMIYCCAIMGVNPFHNKDDD